MEVGDDKVKKDSGTHQYTNLSSQYSNADSQVFDVVIDPLTDFQVSELNSQPTSPQQSYNLTSPASPYDLCEETHKEHTESEHSWCESESSPAKEEYEAPSHSSSSSQSRNTLLYNIIDSHLKKSDITVANCSGSGAGESSVSSSGVGSSSNHHRLVVAEVHRFGYRPPCAGSPHDLASCPAAAASAPYETYQSHKYALGKSTEFFDRCDALKALNQASSALALTETLIGPLRIPPVPQKVLNEVVYNMESKVKVPVSVNNGTSEDIDSQTTRKEVDARCSSFAISPSSMSSVKNPLSPVTFEVGDQNQGSRRGVGSLPSILHPGVHQHTTRATSVISSRNEKMDNTQVDSMSVRDLSLNTLGKARQEYIETVPERHKTASPPIRGTGGKSRVITVPVGMSDHGPVEVYREVHQYPASSITTVVEKCSYLGQMQPNVRPPSGTSKRKKILHKLKKQENSNLGSKSSIASASSTCTSVASGSTLISQSSSELTPMTQSQASSSKTSLNDMHSDSAGPISKPVLSAAIKQMRQALESVSNTSDNHSDKSSGGIEVASSFSDTSSNLSTLSDLSGYEDEYIRIKRLVSDAVIPPEDYKKMKNKMNIKPSQSKPVPSHDYEKVIRDLQAQKEDLEIQLHRLSIQVQNAVREKELYQQQLELMQTKVTETNQKQYFEVLKQRANLEGQLEMLKQELENTVYEKHQLQSKFSDFVKECEESRSLAASAKEAESQIKARLSKYEETNKELEEKLKESSEKFERISKNYEKVQREIKDNEEKNEHLELSLAQLRDTETQMMEEIKGLRSQILQLQSECQTRFEAQAEAESAANKASTELQALQTSSVWYQEQLQIAQSARSNLQQELLEARSSLARVTSEKETFEIKVQTLIHEAEDGQARAVREKASLVAHLEALQADMAEREAVLSQLERDRGSDTKLMEDRRQRLEQDRHRIHKLRLELSDTERQLDFFRDDLKHKCALLAKYESELKDLKTSVAVNQEVLRERDIRIQNLEQTLGETRLSAKDYQEERKVKDSLINSLKEEKLKLEVSLTAANSEKREVDDAIMKLREDMTKLSSNFYRMKHDLAAKDRQIEVLMREAKDDIQIKLALEKKFEALEKKAREDEEKKGLTQEVERLQLSLREISAEKEELEKELTDIRRTSKTIEIEKKGLNEAVHLREEQIQNMQCSLESYREAILKKDEELYIAHEQTSTMEKTYMELRRNWETLKEENLVLRHDAEAYGEHEKAQKREMSDLKDSIQKERKLKQNLEKKTDGLVKTHEEDKSNFLKEKENLDELVNKLSQELQLLKNDRTKTSEDKVHLERKYNELYKEFLVTKEEKCKLESRVKEVVAEIENCKINLNSKFEVIKSFEVKIDSVSKENCDIKEKLTSFHNEREKQVMELEALLKVRTDEVTKLKKMRNDTESSLMELTQEKNMLSSHVNNLLAEKNHLKKTAISHETLVKESKTPSESNNPNTKKSVKSSESLHKEIAILQKKLSDYENKMREAVKQKGSIQSTIRNTKKENILMRAKLKELDALKKRCKELELSKDPRELESFEVRLKELESKLDTKHNELLSLSSSLNEKTSHIQTLKQQEQELCAQAKALHVDKSEMQEKILSLEGIHQKLHQEISNYQQQLKIAENERDEWMAKYESLRDFIPERDTSTQPAVQLGTSSHQSFPNGEESVVVSGTNDSTGILRRNSVNNLNYLGKDPQASVTNGTQFDKTMADLQAQVNLTSEALQSKEQQIHDLQEQLRSLMQEGTEIRNNPQASDSCSGEGAPEPHHEEQIKERLEGIEQLKVSTAMCHNCKMKRETQPKAGDGSEVQSLYDKIRRLESEVNGKEDKLQETQMKMTVAAKEFREKQRRYESNVRLLTRKLKEHMKGRKSAEKEMQVQAEDHQQLLNEEQQRYVVLRCRCMELEGLRETLDGQVAGLESEVEEVRGALGRARQEACEHHNNTLKLQKEIGRLQELCKTADNLRSEVSNLEESIRQREKQLKEVDKELQVTHVELKQSQEASALLTSSVQKMKSQNEKIQHEYDAALLNLKVVRQDLEAKDGECSRAQQSASQLQSVIAELRNCLNDADMKGEQLTSSVKRLREEKQAAIEEHQSIRVQLKESLSRTAVLENHIKVIEGEVKVGKEEVNQIKEQLIAKDSSHQVKVTQLEQSVARARQEVVALTSQLDQVQQERVSYQTQATELRTALHSTLRQLKACKVEEEARAAEASTIKSEVGIIPSPSPLDLTALTELMERSARPLRSTLPLTNLESCLSSLKAEVNMLQTQLQSKTEELADGSIHEGMVVLEEKFPVPETTERCTRDGGSLNMESNKCN